MQDKFVHSCGDVYSRTKLCTSDVKENATLGLLGKSCKRLWWRPHHIPLSTFRNYFQWCHEKWLGIKVQKLRLIALSNDITQPSGQEHRVNAECHIPAAGHVLVASIRLELQTGGQTYLILHKLACLWLLKMCTSWVSTHMARETLEETQASFSTLSYFVICGPIFGRGCLCVLSNYGFDLQESSRL